MGIENNGANGLPEDGRALTLSQQIFFSAGMLTTSMAPSIIVGWLMYFYAPPPDSGLPVYLPLFWIGIINFAGRLVDSVADPFVGYWSDRSKSPRGRRIPFIMYWTPPLALSFACLWFPPAQGESNLNALWLFVWISIFWFAYTAVVAPYISMHPEITPYRKERITLSTWMGVFELSGMILATIVAGEIISRFKGGISVLNIHFSDGYKFVAVVGGLLILTTYYIPVFTTKETPHDETKDVPFGFFESLMLCFKNPSFPPYIIPISLLKLSANMVIAMIPYLVKVLIWPDPEAEGIFHGMDSESVAGIMQGIIIIVAAMLFPLTAWLGGKYGKKPVFHGALIWFTVCVALFATVGMWPGVSLITQTMIILFMLAPAVSPMFVLQRPLIADVMDHDEKLTGYRREAMYNGVEGLCTKFAAGVSPLILVGLFHFLGNTADNPGGIMAVGPVAAVMMVGAVIVFRKYPFND